MDPDSTRLVPVDGPLDLRRTLGRLVHYKGPTHKSKDGVVWRGIQTPEGPVGLRYEKVDGGVQVDGFGPAAETGVALADDHLGLRDDPSLFETDDPVLAPLVKRHRGLRFGRCRQVVGHLVPTIIGQKVTGAGANRSWKDLVFRHGVKLEAPTPLWAPPSTKTLAAMGYYDFHPLGIERKRADAILRVAKRGLSLEKLLELGPEELTRRLCTLPGIGPWTAAIVAGIALGDADAVPVGDYNIPNMVSWALAGEPRGDDERMLELLEPFRPHRGRVVTLLHYADSQPPRYGPRLSVRDIRRM